VISYADDFVILSRGYAARALDWTRGVMERLRLDLNAAKTVIRDARKECFDFLGYTFGTIWFRKEGTKYMSARPSRRSIGRLREKIRQILRPSEMGTWPEVRDRLNALLRGWFTYFRYGTMQMADRAVERNVYDRVRLFLVRRHKVRARGIRRYSSERVFGELGVFLPRPIR
jgi:RNA-directed DNA polymerase